MSYYTHNEMYTNHFKSNNHKNFLTLRQALNTVYRYCIVCNVYKEKYIVKWRTLLL